MLVPSGWRRDISRLFEHAAGYSTKSHFSIDENDKSLVFFQHERRDDDSWIIRAPGEWFFFHFTLCWGASFLVFPALIYAVLVGNWACCLFCLLLVQYTYGPLPKHFHPFRLWIFLNVSKYFKSSSYRLCEPEKWPEYSAILHQLKKEKNEEKTPSSSCHPNLHDIDEMVDYLSAVPSKTRIWLFHPHGFIGYGWGVQAFNPYAPHVYNAISTALYYVPPIICYTSHCGKPSPVTPAALKGHLRHNRSFAMIPGGFEEATVHPNKGDRIYLTKRLGIFKYALEFGVELVPIFTFGEARMFKNVQGYWNFRLWLNSFSIPAILPWGRMPFPWMPQDDMCHVVVGPPIAVKREEVPISHEKVLALQRIYIERLTDLYEKYKKRFYGKAFELPLEIL